uniref:Uncharacterized protein n=1 Tax=Siphoviridae sp. ctk5O4 TaxID=2827921 RepID=A0A8S5SJI3_9CAUD|nr:MAG TPA: hypothetical protein [Siphoviridae sp. ctk5O4]
MPLCVLFIIIYCEPVLRMRFSACLKAAPSGIVDLF